MNGAPRVLIHCQHLLGTGHLRRASLLAAALARRGAAVTLASGGFPIEGLDPGGAALVQLPPVRAADATFANLIDSDGQPIDAAWRQRRLRATEAVFDRVRPHILITETFPLGRRAFRFELLPLLTAAGAHGVHPIAASVRDILVSKPDPARNHAMAALARRHYARILVHGERALTPLAGSFAAAPLIEDLLSYTGYVAAAPPPKAAGHELEEERGEVVVSVGGGIAGADLLLAAAPARALSRCAGGVVWRLLHGADTPSAVVASLHREPRPGVIVEPARADFPALLSRALLSVSMAGYNTACDIQRAGCRAVLVPLAAAGEDEQRHRARLFEAAGRAVALAPEGLTPARLAAAVDRALREPVRELPVRLDGAARAAEILLDDWRRGP